MIRPALDLTTTKLATAMFKDLDSEMWLLLGIKTYQTHKNIENYCHCNEANKDAPNNHREGWSAQTEK